MKKLTVGFFLTVASAVLAAAGIVFYLVNTGTAYFASLGVNGVIVGCAIAAIVLQAAYLFLSQKNSNWVFGFLPAASSALLMLALANFIVTRVNGIAGIMTFENNASNMADLSSAIIGIVLCLLATVISIVSSFFDVSKE